MTTYTQALNFIRTATNAATLYDDIRAILRKDLRNYPEDYQIKRLQREADNKHDELLGIDRSEL
jgi:hypothetical protein